MPGEFGGGIIEINTKAVPSENFRYIFFISGLILKHPYQMAFCMMVVMTMILDMMMVQEIFRHLFKMP